MTMHHRIVPKRSQIFPDSPRAFRFPFLVHVLIPHGRNGTFLVVVYMLRGVYDAGIRRKYKKSTSLASFSRCYMIVEDSWLGPQKMELCVAGGCTTSTFWECRWDRNLNRDRKERRSSSEDLAPGCDLIPSTFSSSFPFSFLFPIFSGTALYVIGKWGKSRPIQPSELNTRALVHSDLPYEEDHLLQKSTGTHHWPIVGVPRI